MLRRLIFCAVLFAAACKKDEPPPLPAPVPKITAIAPRMISNATDTAVMIWGENLPDGAKLAIRSIPPVVVPTKKLDHRHLTARIPPGVPVIDQLSVGVVMVGLLDARGSTIAGDARLGVANDSDFAMPYALELGDEKTIAWVASKTTDELRALNGEKRSVCDRPRAFARLREQVVVLCEEGRLLIGDRAIDVGPDAIDLAIDETKNLAYVTSHALDRVVVLDLGTGKVREMLPAGVNPQAIAIAEQGALLVVGNYQSADVSIIDVEKKTETRVRPGPGSPIIGGHTAKFTNEIMGGTPVRAIVYSNAQHLAFAATLGPNIGPNADRMEVSQNGGISVIDARAGKWVRHVSMLYGVPDALALDDARGVLYVADGSTGRVVALATKALKQLWAIDLPVPDGVPLIRPAGDFGVEKRARIGLHFGAKAIRVSADGARVFVLSRYSGEVVSIDTKARVIKDRWRGFVADSQQARRRGQIVYETDLGNTRMTCDTCHPEGHSGGIMFSKGRPIRIYRAPTCRAIRESPPYFTPSRLPSIRRTITDVLARNRFQNPPPTEEEIAATTEYVGSIVGPPNPFCEADGSLPAELVLPDGARGRPARGLVLFEGKAGCAEERCHPPPHFTADQAQPTRGLLHQLETPVALMLRPALQDLEKNYGQPAPSLAGVWDQFPLFLSGAGGNEVLPDGSVAATKSFALRWILENPAWRRHSRSEGLSADEMNDLLAYLMTL